MIEYKVNLNCSLYRLFKKAEIYLNILNAKVQIKKELKLKSEYKAFKSIQATLTPKQNP